jgi:hypothetical protein
MIKKYEGYMVAKTTIHHGGNEKTGSTPILRSIFMYVDGLGEVQIPYINGNAIRGKLRRMLMKDFFTNLDYNVEELNPKLYHVFFSGGALESTEATVGVIDLELRRKIRKMFPPLALLGGAIGNQMIQGKLKVGHAFPVCREYSDFLPEFLRSDPRTNKFVRSFTDEAFNTRRDDLRADREEDEQAVQMKVDFECFIPGTKFFHWFVTEYTNELEDATFGRMMELFRQSPYVGGMASVGSGEVFFEYSPNFPSSEKYFAFIDENKQGILELLQEVGSRL